MCRNSVLVNTGPWDVCHCAPCLSVCKAKQMFLKAAWPEEPSRSALSSPKGSYSSLGLGKSQEHKAVQGHYFSLSTCTSALWMCAQLLLGCFWFPILVLEAASHQFSTGPCTSQLAATLSHTPLSSSGLWMR